MLSGDAPASPRLAAALSFLKQLNDLPDSVDASSIEPLHAVGIGDNGVIDLVMICFGFNLIDRVADALAFDLPATGFEREARFAWKFGYRLSSGKWFRWPRTVDTSRGAQALVDALLLGPAYLPTDVRCAAFCGRGLDEPALSYVRTVQHAAYQVTDHATAALRQSGYSEDQVFELTLCASLGAAIERLRFGLNAAKAGWSIAVPCDSK